MIRCCCCHGLFSANMEHRYLTSVCISMTLMSQIDLSPLSVTAHSTYHKQHWSGKARQGAWRQDRDSLWVPPAHKGQQSAVWDLPWCFRQHSGNDHRAGACPALCKWLSSVFSDYDLDSSPCQTRTSQRTILYLPKQIFQCPKLIVYAFCLPSLGQTCFSWRSAHAISNDNLKDPFYCHVIWRNTKTTDCKPLMLMRCNYRDREAQIDISCVPVVCCLKETATKKIQGRLNVCLKKACFHHCRCIGLSNEIMLLADAERSFSSNLTFCWSKNNKAFCSCRGIFTLKLELFFVPWISQASECI